MTALATPSSSVAFATPNAGEDYLATEAHYLSLAGRLVAALRRGSLFVLLTGDPPPDLLLLSRALETAAAWWYAVVPIARGSYFSRDHLLRGAPRLATSDGSDGGFQTAGSALALSPLFVFDAADGLSDEQIENLYQSLVHSDRIRSAGVLLARDAFLARLERSNPRLIEGELTARLRLQELGRDEIEPFIRRQRRPGEQPNSFTAEAITAIADISRGDPALVNHLARLTLEFAALAGSKAEEPGIDGEGETRAPVAPVHERRPAAEAAASLLPSSPPQRRRLVHRVQIGLLLVLAITGLVAMPDGGISSLAQRAEQSLAAIRSVDFLAWMKTGRDKASPGSVDSASQLADATAAPSGVGQATGPQAAVISVAAIPEHPDGERADASSTNKTALPQPTPNDQSETIPTPAPEPISARSMGAAPATAAATTAQPPESQPAPPQSAATQPRLSAEEIAALVTRGDDLVGVGDLASARLYYARAVEAGDGRAALRMGATFDPAFLDRASIRGAAGDQREALFWYHRARDLGQAEAERRLKDFKQQ